MTASTNGQEDPHIRAITEILSDDPRDDVDPESILRRFPELRAIEVVDRAIDGPYGPVRGRVYRGPRSGGAGLVWVHGGAFIAGGLDQPESHWVALELAARGVPVLALDHRKAVDGVHHPVPSDEIRAGWRAAAGDENLLGVPVERLHLGGASAGGNLSAGVTARLLSEREVLPASLVLVYPILHDVLPQPSPAAAAAAAALPAGFRFHPDLVRAINLNYVGAEAGLRDPVAFPANGDVAGFPPTLILNAEADDLRASGEAFAAQLEAAGAEVLLAYEPGTRHGYLDQPGLAEAVRSLDRIAGWIASSA